MPEGAEGPEVALLDEVPVPAPELAAEPAPPPAPHPSRHRRLGRTLSTRMLCRQGQRTEVCGSWMRLPALEQQSRQTQEVPSLPRSEFPANREFYSESAPAVRPLSHENANICLEIQCIRGAIRQIRTGNLSLANREFACIRLDETGDVRATDPCRMPWRE